jgi:hypothetical protein
MEEQAQRRRDAALKAAATRKKNQVSGLIKKVFSKAAPVKEKGVWLMSEVVSKDKKQRYYYNKDNDTYITHLKQSVEPIVVNGAVHRNMCKAYSNWHGTESTVSEICGQFDFPEAWFIEYKTIHGWKHDQEPFVKEEFQTKPVTVLADEALADKRRAFRQEFAEKEWDQTKKSAEKWDRFSENVLRYVGEYLENMPEYEVPQVHMNESEDPYAIVVAAMDLHYGKGCWRDETGASYDRQQAEDLLMFHTEKLMSRLNGFGRPEKIILPIGNDWFHVDNPAGRTTAGTPQDMEGTPGIILTEGLELAVRHIDLLRQIAPVEIIPSPGNHDRMSGTVLMMYLYAWYRNTPDVSILKSIRSRNYTSYGNTLLAFAHGDDPTPNDLMKLIPFEAKSLYTQCEHTALFTGHLHFERTQENHGVTWFQCNSLAPADRWHYNKGFVMSRRAMSAYLIFKEDGPCGTFISPHTKAIQMGFKMKNKNR